MLPGTGGLTRVTDKRQVRKDLADVFATKSEGVRGQQAVEWRLVDEVVPQAQWDETVRRAGRRGRRPARTARPTAHGASRCRRCSARRPPTAIALPARARPTSTAAAGLVEITVLGPDGDVPDTVERVHELGADFWPLAMTRELDDLILRLRTNELELGTWMLRTEGDVEDALAFERVIAEHSGDRLAGQRDPPLLQADAQAPRRDLAAA